MTDLDAALIFPLAAVDPVAIAAGCLEALLLALFLALFVCNNAEMSIAHSQSQLSGLTLPLELCEPGPISA